MHNKLGVALLFLIFAVIPSAMLSILLTDANECINSWVSLGHFAVNLSGGQPKM